MTVIRCTACHECRLDLDDATLCDSCNGLDAPYPAGLEHLRCPNCHKRGVRIHMKPGEDNFACRYCVWYAFASGNARVDRRERARLAKENEPCWECGPCQERILDPKSAPRCEGTPPYRRG